VKQREPRQVRKVLGLVVGAAFSMWALRRHISLYQLVVTGITAIIANVVTGTRAKTLAGWASLAFLAWWAIYDPASSHPAATHVAAFMSAWSRGVQGFVVAV
jgi:hypothetical protein